MNQDQFKPEGDFRWETYRGNGEPELDPAEPPRFWPTLARFFRALRKKQMRYAFGSRAGW